MSLETFVTKRQEMLRQELANFELELTRLEQRRRVLRSTIDQWRAGLEMLEEWTLYQQGKHPLFPAAPSQEAPPAVLQNGAVAIPATAEKES